MTNPNLTQGVQISVTLSDGVTSIDKLTATWIIADLTGNPDFDPQLEGDDLGCWLATVPAEWYAEASEEGGLLMTHSGGYLVEIPMH